MTPALLFPVESHTGGYLPTPRTVALFFDTSAAIDFISAEAPNRDLYLGEPRYDKRTRGYRFNGHDWRAEYRAWLASVGPQLTHTQGDPFEAERKVA